MTIARSAMQKSSLTNPMTMPELFDSLPFNLVGETVRELPAVSRPEPEPTLFPLEISTPPTDFDRRVESARNQ